MVKIILRKPVPLYRTLTIGRRKTSTAQVFLCPSSKGPGTIFFNARHISLYLQGNPVLQRTLEEPLSALGISGFFDILVKVRGGGLSGQVGATALAISRALNILEKGLAEEHEHSTTPEVEDVVTLFGASPSLIRTFSGGLIKEQKIINKGGYLTRDPRAKERKKYGLRKARKAPQFSKR